MNTSATTTENASDESLSATDLGLLAQLFSEHMHLTI